MESKFRFQNLEIWKKGFQLCDQLYDIADSLEERKYYRFAEQLRGAGLSITNNISEGSGSVSDKEFAQFINFSRRSIFECANITLTINHRNYIEEDVCDKILTQLEELSKMEFAFRRKLMQ